MKNFEEIVKNRRSCRKYTGEEVSEEIVEEILKIALLAPSSWGEKPVHFVVVRDKKMLKEISACKRIGAGPLPTADVAIVVAIDKKNCELWIEDAAVASTYILLAAENLGIGACWIHIRDRAGKKFTADEEIRQLLKIPQNFSVTNIVALGQKGEKKSARTEKDLRFENIHREIF